MSLLRSVAIGDLLVKNNVWLAPLAGVGDRSFRIMQKRFGAGMTFTEMTSAHGLVHNSKKTFELATLTKRERPAGIQVFGSNPEIMAEAVSLLGEYPADIIDINCGCSVPKVLKTGAGAGLLADPGRLYLVVKACVTSSIRPVSVKLRLGLTEDGINVVENALASQEAGASLVTLHPRTASAGYTQDARWEYIRLVKERLSIPVCGNGDIRSPGDAVRMAEETGCDAVMIGRAAIGNPWLIRDTVAAFEAYPETVLYTIPTAEQRVDCALEHLDLIVSFKGEKRGVREIKRHLFRYLKGIPNATHVRKSIFLVESKLQAQQRIRSLLASQG
ncbi:MAG: tRNA dihydrouridine synthase DusB [Spirochaetes bacterium]|nr:tRNA dihydrouridine synthase DusB [Spirochaetota bacterium]